MTRIIYIALMLVATCFVGVSQNKLSDNELDNLDAEIAQKHIYDGKKANRIAILAEKANSSAKFSQDRFNALMELGREYETFISDSALYCFDLAEKVACELKDSIMISRAKIGRIKVLAILGYFRESAVELEDVESCGISDEIMNEWVDAGRQMYAYMVTYALDNKELYDRYLAKQNFYRDMQIGILPADSPERKLFLAEHYVDKGELSQAKLLFGEIIDEVPDSSNLYARAAHNMATIKKQEGQEDVAAYYLALSAISDIKCSVKETMSIQELAIYLYNKGDISHAYAYISSSLADAVFCNARLRTAEVSKIIPLIDGAYKDLLGKQRDTLVATNVVVGVLSIGLIVIIIIVLRQMERVKTARQQLKEANNIKEEYIGHFLDICSIYIDRLENFSKIVTRKITAGQVDELLKMAKASKFTEGQSQQFYDNFDATFLHIYPTFIEEFNKLLLPDEQIIIKEPGRLTTELRIFAFLRMGVDDSNKIASFLNYSINTIYTYRNKIKSKAKNRDTFEQDVMKIGSFS